MAFFSPKVARDDKNFAMLANLLQSKMLRRALGGLTAMVAGASWSTSAEALPRWANRNIVLPSGVWAFDTGLGIGHVPNSTGAGVNLEAAVGVIERLELGLRTGLRFGDGAKRSDADAYARTFDPDTYNLGGEALANPEAHIRYAIVGEQLIEVGLEGRMYLPLASGTDFGVMFGVPLTFHFGQDVRLDTGLLIPLIFSDPTQSVISVPARLWFQASDQLWLGPISGFRAFNPGGNSSLLLGMGLGYQIDNAIDFKTEFLFPYITENRGTEAFGLSAGLQFRIE